MGLHVTNPARIRFTDEGGIALRMTNKTGGASVKGTVVTVYDGGAVNNAVQLTEGDAIDPVGVMYDSGIADGSECWIVIAGRAQVLLKDGDAGVRGYWLGTSDTAGRAECKAAPGLILEHMQEIGHCMESASSGTDVLVYGVLHFN
jgi:hypothetical protein